LKGTKGSKGTRRRLREKSTLLSAQRSRGAFPVSKEQKSGQLTRREGKAGTYTIEKVVSLSEFVGKYYLEGNKRETRETLLEGTEISLRENEKVGGNHPPTCPRFG